MDFRPFLGLCFITVASFSRVLMSVFIKKLAYIDPGLLCAIIIICILVGSLPSAVFSAKNIFGPKGYKRKLIIKSLVGVIGFYLSVIAYKYLRIAEVSTTPAFVSIVAHFYLKESCGIVQSVAVLLTIIGILLSIRLPELLENNDHELDVTTHVTGLLCVFGCVVSYTFVFVYSRTLREVNFSVMQLYTGIIGTFGIIILTYSFSSFTVPLCDIWDLIQLFLVGVVGFLGSTFITLALIYESAGVVSVVKASLDIIISMIFQVIFFGLVPDVYSSVGALLVIGSVALISLRKILLILPEESEKRKRFRYLLL